MGKHIVDYFPRLRLGYQELRYFQYPFAATTAVSSQSVISTDQKEKDCFLLIASSAPPTTMTPSPTYGCQFMLCSFSFVISREPRSTIFSVVKYLKPVYTVMSNPIHRTTMPIVFICVFQFVVDVAEEGIPFVPRGESNSSFFPPEVY
jgi:hypothetical protein